MEMTIEEIKKFIDQFSQIPEENVIKHNFTNEKDGCCIIGHHTRLRSENPNDYSNDNCSDTFSVILPTGIKYYDHTRFSNLRKLGQSFGIDIPAINNGNATNPKFVHYNDIPSAKQRGLKALNYLLTEMELRQIESEENRFERKFTPQGKDFILGKSTFVHKVLALFK